MTWEAYLLRFEQILSREFTNEIYDKEAYRDYVKMNHSRMQRWLKTVQINPKLIESIQNIKEKQNWYLITEPWCGDAAHSVPFIHLMAQRNENISLKIVLRDENTDFIDQYLTNGGRSIPKLIIRSEAGEDLNVWGPRPKDLAAIHTQLKAEDASFDVINQTLQTWYNENKGRDIQDEFIQLLNTVKN